MVNVTLTVPDEGGNVSTCVSGVTVSDTIPPVVLARNENIFLDTDGNATLSVESVYNRSADNCGIATYKLDKTVFTCTDLGENTVVLTVIDVNGNSNSAEAILTVADDIKPTISCIENQLKTTDPGEIIYTATGNEFDPSTFSDNCEVVSITCELLGSTVATFNDGLATTLNQFIFNIGTTNVKWTVTDNSGNIASCSFNVSVKDNEAPFMRCRELTVYLDETGQNKLSLADLYALSAGTKDNLSQLKDLKIASSRDTFNFENIVKDVVVRITAEDEAGNIGKCWALITVLDTFALEVDPINDIVVALEAGECETKISYPEPNLPGGCIDFELIEGIGPNGIFPLGTTNEKWLLTKANDESLEVSFNVIVLTTNQPPAIDVLANLVLAEGSVVVTVPLTGISQGIDCAPQELALSASGINP